MKEQPEQDSDLSEILKEIAGESGIGRWVVDDDGLTVLADEPVAKMLGLSQLAIQGTCIYQRATSESLSVIRSLLEPAVSTREAPHAVTFLRTDGRSIQCSISRISRYPANNLPGWTALAVSPAASVRDLPNSLTRIPTFASTLAAVTAPRVAAELLAAEAVRATEADSAAVFALNESGDAERLAQTHTNGCFSDDVVSACWIKASGLCRKKHPVFWIPDLNCEPAPGIRDHGLTLVGVLGIADGSRPVGVLMLGFTAPIPPASRTRNVLRALGSIFAPAFTRMTVEKNRRIYEERYRMLVEIVNDGFGIVDTNGMFTYVNARFAEMLGYQRDEVIGRHSREFHDNSGRKIHRKQFSKRQTGQSGAYETVWLAKDGRKIPVILSARPLYDEHGAFAGSLAVGTDITELKEVQKKLEAAVEEKDALLREIHHRVKNNLQAVASLLRVQSRYVEEERSKELFSDSELRVHSMAYIHEMLYRSSDMARIDFRKYFDTMITRLLNVIALPDCRVQLIADIQPMELTIDTAVPCGLIANELVANAFRHAFPGGAPGLVRVTMKIFGNEKQLEVIDDGIGLPEHINVTNPQTMGLKLVHILARQIGARLTLVPSKGAHFKMVFRDKDLPA